MRLSQTLNLRISEIRQRLNEISVLEGDDFTTEVRSESEALQTEFADVEVKYRSAVIAESDDDDAARRALNGPDSEGRELQRLHRAGERGRDHPGRDGETELSRCRAGATTSSRTGRDQIPPRHASRRAAGRRRDHCADERRD